MSHDYKELTCVYQWCSPWRSGRHSLLSLITGGSQGGAGRGLPGLLSKIADKRKCRGGGRWCSLGNMRSRGEKWVLGGGPVFSLGCAINVIIVHGNSNAGRVVSGRVSGDLQTVSRGTVSRTGPPARRGQKRPGSLANTLTLHHHRPANPQIYVHLEHPSHHPWVGYDPMNDGRRYTIRSPTLSNPPPTRPTLPPPFTGAWTSGRRWP